MPLPLHHSRHPSSSDLSSQSGYPSHLCAESDSTIRCSKIYLDQLCNGKTKRLLITSSTGMHSDFGGPEAKTIVVFSSEWSASITFWVMAQYGYTSRKLYFCMMIHTWWLLPHKKVTFLSTLVQSPSILTAIMSAPEITANAPCIASSNLLLSVWFCPISDLLKTALFEFKVISNLREGQFHFRGNLFCILLTFP